MRDKEPLFLYIISFLQGGCLLLAEIAASQAFSTAYGNTVYLWATVLGFSLIGLALGYFSGGKKNIRNYPAALLKIFAALLVVNLTIAFTIWPVTKNLNTLHPLSGLLLLNLIFVLPPLFFYGTISPLLIGRLNQSSNTAGKTVGSVFFTSTIGGVVFVLAATMVLLPTFGIKEVFYFMAVIQVLAILFLLPALQNSKTRAKK